jgi:citrate lyase subunit beta/citryl-CoA lyase
MGEIITTGNKGKTVRSDCFVTLEMKDSGGLEILLESKVEVMYGNANRELAKEVLTFFGIQHASLKIEDSGALPLVLTARIEAAIKKLVSSD